MTDAEKREAIRQFITKWQGKGKEDEHGRSYWIDLLAAIGMNNITDRVQFEKKVKIDGHIKRIDVYIPETHVIIEQKSIDKALDKTGHNSGNLELTPYEQAKRYNDNLGYDERARWIVTSNFAEIWIYDMSNQDPEPIKIALDNLQDKYPMLDFLMDNEIKKVNEEMEVSLQAGEIVGKLYDAFLKQYKNPNDENTLKSLNKLCVRIVFCLYAEDAGIFGKRNMFHNYLQQFESNAARKGLINLFKVLDQKLEERDPYLADDDPKLAEFPYVNGSLFSDENIEIPPLTDELMNLILVHASEDFDWSKISPTIFGAVFESTLNPETRRAGGMHYTSIENIHKVIDPLFLDDLKTEFNEIKDIAITKTRKNKLEEFQKKLSELTWFDPACGSGNFLTETYLCIRRLENEALKLIHEGQVAMGTAGNPIKVNISQFYGIEINDFAVAVAQTALWIAESQMMKETEDILYMKLDFLPLTTNAYVIEGNALKLNWEKVVPKDKLSYIIGNPPFVGASLMTKEQKSEAVAIYGKIKLSNSIDYVGAWYCKAAEIMQGTSIKSAFVSTNSITQGEQVAPLWGLLLNKYHVHIDFAYRTFVWNSEASNQAKVHCVIIGFSQYENPNEKRFIFYDENKKYVKNINPYLLEAPNVLITSSSKPICSVPKVTKGNQPSDGGNLILTDKEKDQIIKAEPWLNKWIKPYIGSTEYINNKIRYCFWLKDITPNELKQSKILMERVNAVKEMRENSTAEPTRKKALTPTLFFSITQPDRRYLMIPRVSSKNRRYVPIGFVSPEIIASDACTILADATLYQFGILTSNVHNAWMRTVCGRMKSDYRYSGGIVYNTFPWPTSTEEKIKKIEETAQGILDARKLFPDSSLADLYDPLTMPSKLRKAHQENDKAVMKAYGFDIKNTSEADCVAKLMEMYKELTSIDSNK